jgi:hypothetical protein
MIAMLASLTLFFFAATLFQLFNLNARIAAGPQIDSDALLAQSACAPSQGETACIAHRRLNLSFVLEAKTVALRHHQANVLLMSAIWSRYLGFITGMILALVGATFILGKLVDGGTSVGVEGAALPLRLMLATASPGIVMVVSGVVLMLVTVVTLYQFSTRDAAIYFSGDVTRTSNTLPSIYPEPGLTDSPAKNAIK